MGLLAKLISLKALQTQAGPGHNHVSRVAMSRADGGVFERIIINQGEEFEFEDRLVPFDNKVEIVLTAADTFPGLHLGSVIIMADEHNRGEMTKQFDVGIGSLYDLTYKVI
jgi:hypothetical protein